MNFTFLCTVKSNFLLEVKKSIKRLIVFIYTAWMFKFMFLGPCQIMWKLNGLSVKIYSTKVTYFGNTRSKVGDLACHLLIIFVWFINQLDVFHWSYIFFPGTACPFYLQNILLKEIVCFAKFRKSYKITFQLMKYTSQLTKCEVRIYSLIHFTLTFPIMKELKLLKEH